MQHIAVLSVNHKIAPVEIREKVAFSDSELNKALGSLSKVNEVDSCAILSTCNRSEIYSVVNSTNPKLLLSKPFWEQLIFTFTTSTSIQYIAKVNVQLSCE